MSYGDDREFLRSVLNDELESSPYVVEDIVKKYIEENLTIEIQKQKTDYYSNGYTITVRLVLNGKSFCSAEIDL